MSSGFFLDYAMWDDLWAAMALMLVIAAIIINLDFLTHFYLENQQTNTGIILNSSIIGLLLIGLPMTR